MKKPQKPLFLARQSYRRRRLIDAARLVPIFGLALMMVPLLWMTPETGSLAWRGIYLFAIWAALVIISAFLARRLQALPENDPPPKDTTSDVL